MGIEIKLTATKGESGRRRIGSEVGINIYTTVYKINNKVVVVV